MKKLFGTAAALLLAAGVGVASAGTVHVTLTGSHEAPPVKTMARGSAVIEVTSDGAVSGKVTTHGIKGTMAHIHAGAPGEKGPPIWTTKPLARCHQKHAEYFYFGLNCFEFL